MHRHWVALVLLLLAFSVLHCKTMKGVKHAKPCVSPCKGDLSPKIKPVSVQPMQFSPGTRMIVQNYIALQRLRDCPPVAQTEPKGSGGFSCVNVRVVNVHATSAGIKVTPEKLELATGDCVRWEATVDATDLFTAAIESVDFIDSDDDSGTYDKTKNPEVIGNYCTQTAPNCVMYVGLPERKDPATGGLLKHAATGELVGYSYALKVLYGMRSYVVDPELVVNCGGTCTE